MATVDQIQASDPAKAPVRDTFRLTLTINGTAYRVLGGITSPDAFAAFGAVRAFGLGNDRMEEWHHVAQTLTGNVYNCPAFQDNATCKHVRTLVAAGLLDADPATAQPRMDPGPDATLAEKADREANAYRAWGTPVGDLFARTFEELATKIRMTQATTPDEYEGRIEVLDAGIREQWEARGYEEGRRSAYRCGENAVD
jgi:hypothetical protein